MKAKEKKSHFLFAVSNKVSIFALIKLQKTMRTMLVNTYWWWHPLQLRQS
ncbi:epimerase [Bacteroides ovatus]|uniref:Epimerase n=1 Tax=Bacteroides ovatus TaxID=28116 RepID=A0A1Y4PU14_BACOV|nr:epimerase [Bacteroides ovatus]RGE75543.1 epimerase [Bacteroides sp. AF32-8BH]RGE82293.1 epimerase [Bacteroides sp. AM56-10ce]KAA3929134.1 epimerase [Bacteroides ovatus]KAA3970559.1 epimerase [Bacteroides ovatus]